MFGFLYFFFGGGGEYQWLKTVVQIEANNLTSKQYHQWKNACPRKGTKERIKDQHIPVQSKLCKVHSPSEVYGGTEVTSEKVETHNWASKSASYLRNRNYNPLTQQ